MFISKFKSRAIVVLIGLLIFPSLLWAQELNSAWGGKRVFYAPHLILSLVPTAQYTSNKEPLFKIVMRDFKRNTEEVWGDNFICNFNFGDKNLAQCLSAIPTKDQSSGHFVRDSIVISKTHSFTPNFSLPEFIQPTPVVMYAEYNVVYSTVNRARKKLWASYQENSGYFNGFLPMVVNSDIFFPKVNLIQNSNDTLVIPIAGNSKTEWIKIKVAPLSEKGFYKISLQVAQFKDHLKNSLLISETTLSEKSFCSLARESGEEWEAIGVCRAVNNNAVRTLVFSKFKKVKIESKWEPENWSKSICVSTNYFVQVAGDFSADTASGAKIAEKVESINSVIATTNSITRLDLLRGHIYSSSVVENKASNNLSCK